MPQTGTFHCSVITPERSVLDCAATFVAFPAHDGEIGVLPNRAPLVCKLGIGPLRVDSLGKTEIYFIDGGFAQMQDNRLTILTEQANKASELKPGPAEQALAAARAMPIPDDQAFEARQRAIKRAQVQLRLAR
ncbi:MAG: ATP synthase F1 subunit epsilon [Phycisphaerales bacterium]|nr:ATP synthase F1 subunit epsilon [Phycisphaerales bacterium]